MSNYSNYYKEKLELALEYQDFITERLLKDHGISINQFSSKKYQQKYGESAFGIEIKFDMMMSKTGNVYIEVAEKSNPSNPEYKPSGIYRNDNSWLYLIGDYAQALLFSKHQLQKIYEDEKYCKAHNIIKRKIDTSIGFTYPIEEAKKGYCLYHFIFNDSFLN